MNYMSASLEGATRIQQMFYISLPAHPMHYYCFYSEPGKVMDMGLKSIILTPGVYETGNVSLNKRIY